MTDVAFDAAVGSLTNGWSHTNSAAGNAIVVAARDGTGTSVTAISYGGVSLTKLASHASNAGEGNTDGLTFWGKIGGLPTGANTVTVTGFNSWGGSYSAANAGSFGTVFTTDNNDPDGDTAGSITLTGTAVGGICVAATSFGSSGTPTAGSGSTVRWIELANSDSASGNGWLIDKVSAASSTAVSWTNIDQDWWGTVGVEIKPADGGSHPTGTGAVGMKKMKIAGTSTEKSVGTGAVHLKKMAVAGTSHEKTVASGAVHMKKMGVSGSSHEKSVGTGAISMKKMGVAGTSHEKTVGTGAIHLKKMGLAGTSTEKTVGIGAVHLKKMSVAGTSTEKTVGTGAVHLKKMGISGSSTEKTVGTGAVHLKKMGISGEGSAEEPGVITGVGNVHLKKMGISGTSTERTVGTGAVHLKKMGIRGSSNEWAVGTGAVHMKKMGISGSGSDFRNTGTGAVHMKKMGIRGSSGGHQAPSDPLFVFSPL
jgi:hypothetical protein